jgi:nucleoside-diphosphate-sugar epimerase
LRPNKNSENTSDNDTNMNSPPFREDQPITTPSTMAGASKHVDKILAQTYHQAQQQEAGEQALYRVGLRFFCVYGPWGLPGSPVFAMAEREP